MGTSLGGGVPTTTRRTGSRMRRRRHSAMDVLHTPQRDSSASSGMGRKVHSFHVGSSSSSGGGGGAGGGAGATPGSAHRTRKRHSMYSASKRVTAMLHGLALRKKSIENSRVRVGIRVRPLLPLEAEKDPEVCWEVNCCHRPHNGPTVGPLTLRPALLCLPSLPRSPPPPPPPGEGRRTLCAGNGRRRASWCPVLKQQP